MTQRIIGWVQSATDSESMRACFQENLLICLAIAAFIVYGTGLRMMVSCIRSQWATYGPHKLSRDSRKHERMLLKHLQTAISKVINGMLLVLQFSQILETSVEGRPIQNESVCKVTIQIG